ncbi:MAG TPA: Dyp-type peroxidase [Oligoflexus sp.]|uniref:Dyp-type peroxidase n=1 Tax=Oligoflexus sp. TaxID=1971216 RepID=UPI002D3DA575|nr:Dyp-type peroxidase [Oligoflexus sp.]HYX32410.1 Dyp-type peroxidase [Oligoflexus sp.]
MEIPNLDEIQNGALHPRPLPYVAAYIFLRIDEPREGREFLRRLLPALASASHPTDPGKQAWVTAGLTFHGLKAMGLPQDSLASFPQAFREGMAARAEQLGDVGESGPENWESPLGSPDVHVALSVISPEMERLEVLLQCARAAYKDLTGVQPIWRQDAYMLPGEREPFGFHDGISHPAIEGAGIPNTNPQEAPFKVGEFILGYRNEMNEFPQLPQPEVLGRNGTYIVISKLHTRVAAFRKYLRSRSSSPAEEELMAAKVVGRWRSGAPLALATEKDDPELGADPKRNNNFLYETDDPRGLKCPLGSHIRRMGPRDAAITGQARLHRMIRRSTAYGPMLPEGVLEDDGADRGIIFVAAMANLERQFEFVKTEWINKGTFFGAPGEKDPLTGPNVGSDQFTIPKRPIRRKLTDIPPFVINRGGEYLFIPSLPSLRWLSELDT